MISTPSLILAISLPVFSSFLSNVPPLSRRVAIALIFPNGFAFFCSPFLKIPRLLCLSPTSSHTVDVSPFSERHVATRSLIPCSFRPIARYSILCQ